VIETVIGTDQRLQEFIARLLTRFPQIQEVNVLGERARRLYGQAPDHVILLFAGYENAFDLVQALAATEEELHPADQIIYLYVEYYGGTLSGVWGGGFLPHSEAQQWHEGTDYALLWRREGFAGKDLATRIEFPEDRRVSERRAQERRAQADAWVRATGLNKREGEQRRSDRRQSDRRQSVRLPGSTNPTLLTTFS
jgi:hypothetical protein